jgi:hypothetical protein
MIPGYLCTNLLFILFTCSRKYNDVVGSLECMTHGKFVVSIFYILVVLPIRVT